MWYEITFLKNGETLTRTLWVEPGVSPRTVVYDGYGESCKIVSTVALPD